MSTIPHYQSLPTAHTGGRSSPCERISREIRQCWNRHWSDTPLLISLVQTIHRAIQFEKLTLIFTNLFRLGQGIGSNFTERPLWQRAVVILPCVGSVIGMGFGLYLAITSATEIYYEGGKKEADIKSAGLCIDRRAVLKDAILYLVHAVAWLCDSIASFTLCLSQTHVVISTTIPIWAPFLSIAATCLAPALMLWNWRGIGHSKMLLEHLSRDLPLLNAKNRKRNIENGQGELPLGWLDNELRDKIVGDGSYFLGRHFSIVNRENYALQIRYLIQQLKTEPNNSTLQEKAERVVSGLQHRLIDKIMCHKLTILSTLIATIGTIVLCLGGPLFLAIGLFLVASIIGCVTTWKEGRSVKSLQSTIDEVSPLAEAVCSPTVQQIALETPSKISKIN